MGEDVHIAGHCGQMLYPDEYVGVSRLVEPVAWEQSHLQGLHRRAG